MSSFRRAGAPKTPLHEDPGTRPGLHGQTLISTGLADLDRILGGGLALGTLFLVFEDEWSNHHLTLQKYFVSEGIACKQHVSWVTGPLPGGAPPHQVLPSQQGVARSEARAEPSGTSASKATENAGEPEAELRIAWQYRRYIKKKTTEAEQQSAPSSSSFRRNGGSNAAAKGIARVWCHAFDLSRSLGPAGLSTRFTHSQVDPHSQDTLGCLRTTVDAAVTLRGAVSARSEPDAPAQGRGGTPVGPDSVGRLGVVSVGGPDWAGCGAEATPLLLLRAMHRLKALAQGSRCAVMVSCPAHLYPADVGAALTHIADVAVALEGVRDDSQVVALSPDPATAAGLLHLTKLAGVGAPAPPIPDTSRFLIRRRRKRLTIAPVEIDPDAEQAQEESAGGIGSSVSSVLCSGPPQAVSALDF